VALLDRALFAVTGSTSGIFLTRILAVAGGVLALRRTLGSALAVDARVLSIAAFHPIFFFYGGAARWYPFVFLASALRLSVVLAEQPMARAAQVRFAAGALLGPAAGYVDLPFAAVDTALVLWRTRAAAARGRSFAFVLLVVAAVAIPLLASPIHVAGMFSQANVGASIGTASLVRIGTWLGLGLSGEAIPPVPMAATPTGSAKKSGQILAAVRVLRAAKQPILLAWTAASVATWLALALFSSVWHPRYSLLLWGIAAACVLKLALESRWLSRWLAVACLAFWTLSLAFATSGKGFLKADLNDLTPDVCAAIAGAGPVNLIVAPYPRTAALIRRACRPTPPVLALPLVRHYPDEGEQLADLRARLGRVKKLLLVEDPVHSSLTATNERARSAIGGSCRSESIIRTGALPFGTFKRLFGSETRTERLVVERFACAEAKLGP
jgi:hypothetical protein